jgi:hypothetical protein
MPARLRRRVQALGAMTVPASWENPAGAGADPGVLTTLALACRDTERVRFSYTELTGWVRDWSARLSRAGQEPGPRPARD